MKKITRKALLTAKTYRPGKAGGGSTHEIKKLNPSPAEYIEAGSQKHTYVHEPSGSYMSVVTRPTGKRSASVTDLYVPEEHRNKGIAKALQERVMRDFPSLQGQVSSKIAAKNAYNAGRRMAGNENASLDDIHRAIDENSSVNMWTPKTAGGRIGYGDGGIPTLKTDNPGGSWLQDKIEDAAAARASAPADSYRATLGTGSGVTGWFKGDYELPVDMLKDLPGAMGEEKFRHSGSKLDSLKKSIAEHGYNPDAILVHVREDGQPFIVEGNHRVAEAVQSGRKTIPAEIKYLRGAEAVDGPLHPHKLATAISGRTGYADGGSPDDEGIHVYHSSPHDFDQFSDEFMGTGEGNQAYGHGLYFAEAPEVSGQGGRYWQQFWNRMKSGPEASAASALYNSKFDKQKAIEDLGRTAAYHLDRSTKNYGDGPEVVEGHRLLQKETEDAADLIRSGKIIGPKTYEARIKADPDHFWDWDAPISGQHEKVLNALAPFFPAGIPQKNQYGSPLMGGDIYRQVLERAGGVMFKPVLDKAGVEERLPGGTPARLSRYMLKMGVPGIRYFDAGSRVHKGGSRNYVVFDPKIINVKKKYEYGGMIERSAGGRTSYADGGSPTNDALENFYGPTADEHRGRWYTGTSKDKDFTAFQESRHGTWLTRDPAEASSYAMENDSQGYVPDPDVRSAWAMKKTNTASRVIPAYVRVENPYTGPRPGTFGDNYKKAQSDWFDVLRSQGYDAWAPKDNPNLLVKLTNQGTHIKSAIGNSGAYDMSKKHLAKREGGFVVDTAMRLARAATRR